MRGDYCFQDFITVERQYIRDEAAGPFRFWPRQRGDWERTHYPQRVRTLPNGEVQYFNVGSDRRSARPNTAWLL